MKPKLYRKCNFCKKSFEVCSDKSRKVFCSNYHRYRGFLQRYNLTPNEYKNHKTNDKITKERGI